MSNECGVVEITHEDGRVERLPAYGCGHCSEPVVMNPRRTRPRLTCKKCSRWLCEQNELCQVDCTPIYNIAQDYLDGPNKWTRLVPAIMAGMRTVKEAEESGLLKGV